MTSTVGIDAVLNALTKLHQNDSPTLRALVGAILLALIFAGCYAVAVHKTVTLDVDGSPMTVSTMKSRVIDVVQENGFTVGERDDLYPAGGSAGLRRRHDRAAPQSAASGVDGRSREPPGVDHRVHGGRGAAAAVDGRCGARGRVAVFAAAAGRHGAAGGEREERAHRRRRRDVATAGWPRPMSGHCSPPRARRFSRRTRWCLLRRPRSPRG